VIVGDPGQGYLSRSTAAAHNPRIVAASAGSPYSYGITMPVKHSNRPQPATDPVQHHQRTRQER